MPPPAPAADRTDADPRPPAATVAGEDIQAEAALWLTRRRAGMDARQAADLEAWLAADPRHSRACDEMAATLGALQALPAHAVDALRAGIARPPSARTHRLSSLAAWLPRMATPVLVASVLGAAGYGWWRMPTFEQAYATTRGQQVLATLPDAAQGSTVQLDTSTRINARLFHGRREVQLLEGQAMFAVHSDSSRPFHVLAGGVRITVVGTRFSVRHTRSGLGAGQTVVSVEEGQVRVQREATAGSTAAAIDLRAGQSVAADGNGDLGTVTAVPPAAVAPWRDGRVSFDNTPLAQALAEFERYGSTGLVVRDPALARLPVGGSYGLRQFRHFADTLPQVLPVRLEQRGDVTEIVAR